MSSGARLLRRPGGVRLDSAGRLLLASARHSAPAAAVLAVTAIAIAAAETAFPAVIGHALDQAVSGRPGSSGALTAAVLIAVIVIADALDELALGFVQTRSVAWLRGRAVGHILAAGPRIGAAIAPGDLVGRVVGNAAQAARATPVVIRAVANAIPALGGLVALVLIDPWLCVAFVVALPLMLRLVRAIHGDVEEAADGYLAAQGRMAGRLVEALAGVRTIFAAGRLDDEADRILEPLPEIRRYGEGLWRAQMRIVAQNGLLVALVEVVVLATAGIELGRGRITPGAMLAAGQYALLASTITSLTSVAAAMARSRAAAGRIAEILGVAPPEAGRRAVPRGEGSIELRDVTVIRDGDRALDRVTLHIAARSLVAIVGRSASGKTTLAAVAGGQLRPTEGSVLLDGVLLDTIDPRARCAAITYAFERPSLIGETVADAVGFGVRSPPLYEVVEAASAARADGFIRRLPERYRTELEAAPMSGGEAQRIGLARALAHAGRLIILDDVSASLDTVTEFQILQVLLTGALSDRTRIIVAHRVSTAARADRVVWMDRGGVRAVGAHADLWCEPEYRDVFRTGAAT